jgi:hypothetical protein
VKNSSRDPLSAFAIIAAAWTGLSSSAVNASDSSCLARFLPLNYSSEKISKALADVPGLRDQMLTIMDDPEVPRAIRLTVKRALENQNTEVVNLTADVRAAWNIPPGTGAFALHPSRNFQTWTYTSASETSNQALTTALKPQFNSGHGIATPDLEKTDAGQYHLSLLMHELAHVRFETFMRKHFDQICASLPDSFAIKLPDGTWSMNAQFLDLLHERYEHEMEREMIQAGAGKLTPEWNAKWAATQNMPPAQVKKELSNYLQQAYGYKLPQVLALSHERLSTLLTGGTAVHEVDEALKIYSNPKQFQPRLEELPLALKFVRSMRHSNHQPVSQLDEPHFTLPEFDFLLRSEKGAERLSEIFGEFITRAEKSAVSKKALVKLLSPKNVRWHLEDHAGWSFPMVGNAPLTWKKLMVSHPLTQVLGEAKPLPGSKFSVAVQRMISVGLRVGSMDVPKDRDVLTFSDAKTAADGIMTLKTHLYEHGDLFETPVRELAVSDFKELEKCREDWDQLLEFWDRLGLKSSFLKKFSDSATFCSSNQSFLKIYEKLAAGLTRPAPRQKPSR